MALGTEEEALVETGIRRRRWKWGRFECEFEMELRFNRSFDEEKPREDKALFRDITMLFAANAISYTLALSETPPPTKPAIRW